MLKLAIKNKTIKIIISIILSFVVLSVIYIFSLNKSGLDPVEYVCDLEKEKDCFSRPWVESYFINNRKIATKYSPCCSEDLFLYEINKIGLFKEGSLIRVSEKNFNRIIKIYEIRYGDKLKFEFNN